MQEIVYHTQFIQEDTYWWFVARNNIVKFLISKYCPDLYGKTVLDVGCGTGGFSSLISKDYNVVCLDTSVIALEYCKRRGLSNLHLSTLGDFNPIGLDIFATLFLDVIEHIDDDISVIKKANEILQNNGYFVATVPAYQWLWSNHDIIHMHKRRYTKNSFNEIVIQSGFEIVFSTYFNSILFLPAVMKRFYDRIMNKENTDTYSNAEVIEPVTPFLNKLFQKIFLSERFFLSKTSLPFGLSIITIAKKI